MFAGYISYCPCVDNDRQGLLAASLPPSHVVVYGRAVQGGIDSWERSLITHAFALL